MNKSTQFGRQRARGAGRTHQPVRWPVPEFLLAALAVGALAYVALERGFVSIPFDRAPLASAAPRGEAIDRHFAPCSGAGGTCVIDGDTIRVEGVSIRIADIDTPEVRNYGCPQELALGQAATVRLVALLNQGPFIATPYSRDEDVYGRKLRILERDGQSLGMVLVSEGLARAWDGARRDWCV
ncbi:thermonuclease family protein [Pelagibacterium sediminicola]|uniref:thermonuclease family protein n=1 Tax=Pelagibacterium sediminicola TaxID=2248761 RepID=UPI001FE8DB50|nr:thermonuclease family protein [Pelagibacterium sediminicola]